MTEQLKVKLETWEKGESFMKEAAEYLGATIEERDETQIIFTERCEISYFPDDREFAFIKIKIYDDSIVSDIKNILSTYE